MASIGSLLGTTFAHPAPIILAKISYPTLFFWRDAPTIATDLGLKKLSRPIQTDILSVRQFHKEIEGLTDLN